jgi:hypothetical protein
MLSKITLALALAIAALTMLVPLRRPPRALRVGLSGQCLQPERLVTWSPVGRAQGRPAPPALRLCGIRCVAVLR